MEIPDGYKQPAVLCILRAEERFLLLRRSREPNKGMIVPVGGKIDPHETARAAAIREVREETGIELSSVRYCGVLIESSPTAYNWICFVYVADIEYRPAPPCSEGTLEWFDVAEIGTIPTPRTDAFIYDAVARGEVFAFESEYNAELDLVTLRDETNDQSLFGRNPSTR